MCGGKCGRLSEHSSTYGIVRDFGAEETFVLGRVDLREGFAAPELIRFRVDGWVGEDVAPGAEPVVKAAWGVIS